MPEILSRPTIKKFKPTVDIPESIALSLGDKKMGQRVKAIANYRVIEKTKSFVVLRIEYFHLIKSKRSF